MAEIFGYGVETSRSAYSSCTAGDYSLVVGGDLDGQVNAHKGYVAVYGTVNASAVTGCGVTSDHVVDFAAVSKTLLELSADLKQLPANGSAAVESGTLKLPSFLRSRPWNGSWRQEVSPPRESPP